MTFVTERLFLSITAFILLGFTMLHSHAFFCLDSVEVFLSSPLSNDTDMMNWLLCCRSLEVLPEDALVRAKREKCGSNKHLILHKNKHKKQ